MTQKFQIELNLCLPDYTPIVIQAQGRDLSDLLADATWNYDVPDPSKYHPITELSDETYIEITERFSEEIQQQVEMRLAR